MWTDVQAINEKRDYKVSELDESLRYETQAEAHSEGDEPATGFAGLGEMAVDGDN